MPVREFTDDLGRRWRAWDIKPEAIHPVTKAEDYLADCYVTGWIVFETVSGDEKRRLCPWPTKWMNRTDEQLRELLASADIVRAHRVWEPTTGLSQTAVDASEASGEVDITDLQVVRTFRYPGGRFWTVSVVRKPEDGGPPVLRFTSGVRHIDVRSWRKDWADQPDDVLVIMLRRASPRRISGPSSPGVPQRRWDDSPDARA